MPTSAFGDLHVHTTYSWNASANGTRTTPEHAYRFAKGEEIEMPPYDTSGRATQRLCIDQPAYYCVRVVESPTERWSFRQCEYLPVDQRPAACNNEAPEMIQEMAWTSPIWYRPASWR
ncbi:MAG: DUF3604 domain-containing protein [Pseudomonadales bacterium]|jgi:hypothetical protein|nr:DUF3604 domain-containing protein [Pseudomonadales bacterium]MDP6470291.1 DUF3604 domain-containing protein [Pseudomonadales bacterium]MDP6827197.1 DUF3604 domain-containing protein [Pseudomonadales bacterium]|tara:strand:- start:3966 stop:4319 length:354 start_codon:yes stop_codon:yes gene_type:complete